MWFHVSSVKLEALARVEIRPMHELDIPVVAAIEKAAYQFPWSEGIFRDCLRVGYVCRIIDVAGDVGGYGIMSVGAGEAHILNVCVRDEYRSRGFARKMMLYLLDRARTAGMTRRISKCGRRTWRPRVCTIRWASSKSAFGAATTKRASDARMPRSCAAFSTLLRNKRRSHRRARCTSRARFILLLLIRYLYNIINLIKHARVSSTMRTRRRS